MSKTVQKFFFSFIVFGAVIFGSLPQATFADTTSETRSRWQEVKATVAGTFESASSDLQQALMASGRAFLSAIQGKATAFISDLQSRISNSGNVSETEQVKITQNLSTIAQNIENKQSAITTSQNISDLETIANSIQAELAASKQQLENYKITAVYEKLANNRDSANALKEQLNGDIKKLNQAGKNTQVLQTLAGQYQVSLDGLNGTVANLQKVASTAATEASVSEGLQLVQSGKEQLLSLQKISQDIVNELRNLAQSGQ